MHVTAAKNLSEHGELKLFSPSPKNLQASLETIGDDDALRRIDSLSYARLEEFGDEIDNKRV